MFDVGRAGNISLGRLPLTLFDHVSHPSKLSGFCFQFFITFVIRTFTLQLDEVRVFNRLLSAADVKSDMETAFSDDYANQVNAHSISGFQPLTARPKPSLLRLQQSHTPTLPSSPAPSTKDEYYPGHHVRRGV